MAAENKFVINGRAGFESFGDVQRTWLWELHIDPPKILGIKDKDKLVIHCRSAVIPGRTQEMIKSSFGGMVQWFSSKPEFPGTFAVQMEDTEDMYVRSLLTKWQEAIFGTSKTTANQGYSSVLSSIAGQKQALVAQSLELLLFKYDGTQTVNKFRFVNGVLQGIGDVSLSYESGESVKYDATFQYDYFEVVPNNG